MKKTFSGIVILITLSLFGLLLLQVSWLNNLLEVSKIQLIERSKKATSLVAEDLAKNTGGPIVRIPRNNNLLRNNLSSRLLKPSFVADKYTMQDIRTKLQAAFNEEGLRSTKFEFAVANHEGDYEIQSTNYASVFYDTTNNIRIHNFIASEPNVIIDNIDEWEQLIVVVPSFTKQVWQSLKWILMGGAIFLLIILAAFFVTVKTLLNQKKLSEIKSDFINNMTHEFKTPLATISLAIDALKNERVKGNEEKTKYFTDIIKEENKRMNKHVETILQAATLEKQELQLELKKIAVHQLLNQVIDNFELQLKEKKGTISTNYAAENDGVLVDETHFTNLFSNLLDNAIKYSEEPVRIAIETYNLGDRVYIKIKDNGIGMNKEAVKRIFEKFYRVPTGNIHNVKGFGLGMSYVKTIVDAHKGKIKVESILGKGSTFIVEMPLAKKN